MGKLNPPKIETGSNIVKKFQDVCTGLTLVAMYSIIWILLGALVYRIFLWLF
jgi:hypothetical protein